jgi:uncharacterized protein YecA (UPF0149 family)
MSTNAQHSTTAFLQSGEQETYDAFCDAWTDDLAPSSPLEQTLACEITQAAWRLRRCALIESTSPEDATQEQLDQIQTSIDRARATAQRSLNRNLAELRRVQTERVYRQMLPKGLDTADMGQARCKGLKLAAINKKEAEKAKKEEDAREMERFYARSRELYKQAQEKFANQTQSAAANARPSHPGPEITEQSQSESPEPASIPRGAPCPCGSGQKYKRCCGIDAPPVLSRAA